MNRRNFLGLFVILPGAGRVWRAERRISLIELAKLSPPHGEWFWFLDAAGAPIPWTLAEQDALLNPSRYRLSA